MSFLSTDLVGVSAVEEYCVPFSVELRARPSRQLAGIRNFGPLELDSPDDKVRGDSVGNIVSVRLERLFRKARIHSN